MNLRQMQTMKKMMSSHRHQTVVVKMSFSEWYIDTIIYGERRGHGNPEDEDVEDINRHPEETSTTERGSLSHHATPAHPDGRYSLHYTHGWSHVTRPYSTYAPGPSSSHYTSSSPLGHPYSYQHGTPSPPVHTLPPQHGFIPSSSHHSTPLPPADVYPHDHGIKPSLSRHATPSPSGHPAHSPGVGDEHTATSRRPPAPHRHSSARSSSSRLRSSIPHAIEEIPDFFRPPTAPAEGESPLIYLIAKHGLLHPSSMAAKKMSLVFTSGYLKEGWKWNMSHKPNEIYTGCVGRPHVPPTPRTPPSPVIERSGPRSDDHSGHLTTEIAPSQDQRHLLDDHDEFMEQLMPPP
ncbi:hypothetical protein Syun_022768 [Stephania yunnanensis]|uniref:Uncharacterized protein n=1 Tax=Stephania yunnanensis TaxID=152371 RepID=A0AAP0FFE7_9MAGN